MAGLDPAIYAWPIVTIEQDCAFSLRWEDQRLIGANSAGVISLFLCLMTQPASAFFAR